MTCAGKDRSRPGTGTHTHKQITGQASLPHVRHVTQELPQCKVDSPRLQFFHAAGSSRSIAVPADPQPAWHTGWTGPASLLPMQDGGNQDSEAPSDENAGRVWGGGGGGGDPPTSIRGTQRAVCPVLSRRRVHSFFRQGHRRAGPPIRGRGNGSKNLELAESRPWV